MDSLRLVISAAFISWAVYSVGRCLDELFRAAVNRGIDYLLSVGTKKDDP